MATKDPHVAFIDASEELHQIKLKVRAAIALVKAQAVAGHPLTDDDKYMLKAIQQEAIDATRRVQDTLYTELESHGKA